MDNSFNDVSNAISASIPTFGGPGVSGIPTLSGLQFQPTSSDPNVLELKDTQGSQFVKFYRAQKYNHFQTELAKKRAEEKGEIAVPVYDTVEMVQVITPGDKSNYNSVAEDYHKRNYFKQYSRFRDGKDIDMGTKLDGMEWILAPEIIELNYHGIYTVEQLANALDTLCELLPRGFDLRAAANGWIEMTQGDALLSSQKKLSAEVVSNQETILRVQKEADTLRATVEELKAQMAAHTGRAQVEQTIANVRKKVSQKKTVANEEELKFAQALETQAMKRLGIDPNKGPDEKA